MLPSKANIEFGSYIGTGTYGEDSPNTLNFSFVPKLVVIVNHYGLEFGNSKNGILWTYGADTISIVHFTQSGTSLSWYRKNPQYSALSEVGYQQNNVGS